MDAVVATLSYLPLDSSFWAHPTSQRSRAVVKGASSGTTDYSETALAAAFALHFAKLKQVEADPRLWPEGAERPSEAAQLWATVTLQRLESDGNLPTRIVASAEGGVAICFVNGDKYADIECLNTGAILAVISDRHRRPLAWEVEQNPGGIAWASERIRRFFEESSSEQDG